MNSVSLTVSLGTRGRALGTAANSSMQSPISNGVNQSFSSTLTAGSKITTVYAPGLYTIAASGNLTIDLTSFTNLLNESASSIGKARFLLISHDSTSTASSITVGNAASNQWTFLGLSAATTTFTMKPLEWFACGSQATAGMATSGTNKNLKILNNDGTNSAIVRIVIAGDT